MVGGNGSVQIHIRHILFATLIVAVFFALISWIGAPAVFGIALFLNVVIAFGMPMVIFVFTLALSQEVNKRLDVRSSKTVAVCMLIWLVSVAFLTVFLFFLTLV
jgi:amino acid permease